MEIVTNQDTILKNADWATVQRNGKELYDSGNYEIVTVTQEVIDAIVEGSHGDKYSTQIYFAPGSYQIGWYDCTCPWGQYAHGRKKFTDRPCKHAMALYYWFQSVGKGGLQKQKTSSTKMSGEKMAGLMFTKDNFESEYDSGITTYFAKNYPWYAEIESSDGVVNYAVYNNDTIVARSEDYWMGLTNGMDTADILPTVENNDKALANINAWLAGKTASIKTASFNWENTPASVVNDMYGFHVNDPVYMAYDEATDTEYLVYSDGAVWTGVDIEMIGDGPTATFQNGDLFVDGLASAEEAMKSVEDTEEWMRTASKKAQNAMTVCQCCSKPTLVNEADYNNGYCNTCANMLKTADSHGKIASRSFTYEERNAIEKEGENQLARNRDKLYSNDATSLFM